MFRPRIRALVRVWEWFFGPLCPGSMTIALAICKHVVQAIVCLGPPGGLGSIPLHAMLSVIPSFLPLDRRYVLSLGLIAAVAMASVAMRARSLKHTTVCLLLLPQQLWLSIAWTAALAAAIAGHYADGYIPDGGGWFITGDQITLLLLLPFYTVAVILRASSRRDGMDQ